MTTDWSFDESREVTCITTSYVLGGSPILRVYRDFEGDWQFHGAFDQPASQEVAQVVSLGAMVDLDPTLSGVAQLPYAWMAYRDSASDAWIREKNHPFPTFEENGYYLEDAVWMSQYRDDVDPPAEEIRDNVAPETHVKLMFRFLPEDAEREDNDTERMWVLVKGEDEDGFYYGVLDNDPQHETSLTCGDEIQFHPLHIMAVN